MNSICTVPFSGYERKSWLVLPGVYSAFFFLSGFLFFFTLDHFGQDIDEYKGRKLLDVGWIFFMSRQPKRGWKAGANTWVKTANINMNRQPFVTSTSFLFSGPARSHLTHFSILLANSLSREPSFHFSNFCFSVFIFY